MTAFGSEGGKDRQAGPDSAVNKLEQKRSDFVECFREQIKSDEFRESYEQFAALVDVFAQQQVEIMLSNIRPYFEEYFQIDSKIKSIELLLREIDPTINFNLIFYNFSQEKCEEVKRHTSIEDLHAFITSSYDDENERIATLAVLSRLNQHYPLNPNEAVFLSDNDVILCDRLVYRYRIATLAALDYSSIISNVARQYPASGQINEDEIAYLLRNVVDYHSKLLAIMELHSSTVKGYENDDYLRHFNGYAEMRTYTIISLARLNSSDAATNDETRLVNYLCDLFQIFRIFYSDTFNINNLDYFVRAFFDSPQSARSYKIQRQQNISEMLNSWSRVILPQDQRINTYRIPDSGFQKENNSEIKKISSLVKIMCYYYSVISLEDKTQQQTEIRKLKSILHNNSVMSPDILNQKNASGELKIDFILDYADTIFRAFNTLMSGFSDSSAVRSQAKIGEAVIIEVEESADEELEVEDAGEVISETSVQNFLLSSEEPVLEYMYSLANRIIESSGFDTRWYAYSYELLTFLDAVISRRTSKDGFGENIISDAVTYAQNIIDFYESKHFQESEDSQNENRVDISNINNVLAQFSGYFDATRLVKKEWPFLSASGKRKTIEILRNITDIRQKQLTSDPISVMIESKEYLTYDTRSKTIVIGGTSYEGYFSDIGPDERLGLVQSDNGYTIVSCHNVHKD